MKKICLCLFVCYVMALFSCSKEVFEDLNPDDTCDTQDMSFQSDVLPLFETHCNNCHGSASAFGGISLDNHEGVKATVDAGRLIGAIKQEAGFSSMPQGGSKLAACNIDKISSWVADGALDN